MVVALEASRRNPAGDRLGGSLETQVQGSQRSWYTAEPFRALPLCLPPPSGLSYPQGEAQSGTRVLLDLQSVGKAGVQARSPGLRRNNFLPVFGGRLGKSHFPDNPLHPVSYYILHQKETKNKTPAESNLNAVGKPRLDPLTSEALNVEPKFA